MTLLDAKIKIMQQGLSIALTVIEVQQIEKMELIGLDLRTAINDQAINAGEINMEWGVKMKSTISDQSADAPEGFVGWLMEEAKPSVHRYEGKHMFMYAYEDPKARELLNAAMADDKIN